VTVVFLSALDLRAAVNATFYSLAVLLSLFIECLLFLKYANFLS